MEEEGVRSRGMKLEVLLSPNAKASSALLLLLTASKNQSKLVSACVLYTLACLLEDAGKQLQNGHQCSFCTGYSHCFPCMYFTIQQQDTLCLAFVHKDAINSKGTADLILFGVKPDMWKLHHYAQHKVSYPNTPFLFPYLENVLLMLESKGSTQCQLGNV